MQNDEILLSDDFTELLRSRIRTYGPIREDGFHQLNEQLYPEIDEFRVIFYPNESQHRGRPHCKVVIADKTANYDLNTLEPIVGDLGKWNRTVKKVLKEHKDRLLAFWHATRPDDQKLPDNQ